MGEVERSGERPDERARLEALQDLVRKGGDDVARRLSLACAEDESPRVRYAARKLLDHVQGSADAPESTSGARAERFADAELRELLASGDPEDRLRALTSIGGTGNKALLGEALDALDREEDPRVLSACLQTLGKIGGLALIPRLAPFLRDENARVRANVVEAMMNLDAGLALPLILPLLQDPDHRVQANVSRLLAREGIDEAMNTLSRMLASENVWMRDSAVHALAEQRDPRAVSLLVRAVADRNPSVRAKAQKGLEAFADRGDEAARRFLDGLAHEEGEPGGVDALNEIIEDERPDLAELAAPNPRLRMNIVNEIIACKDVARLPALVDHLRDEENVFVTSRIIAAVGLLGAEGLEGHREVLRRYLSHGDDRTVANTIEALERLDDRSLREDVRPLLRSRNPRVRGNALVYLRGDRGLDLGGILRSMLGEEDPAMRRAAVFVGERIAEDRPEVLRELVDGLGEDRGPLYYEFCQSLQRLGDRGLSDSRTLLEGLRQGAREVSASYATRLAALGRDGLWALPLAAAAAVLLSPASGREDVFSLALLGALVLRDWPLSSWGRRGLGLELKRGGERLAGGHRLLRQLALFLPFWNAMEGTMPLVDPEGKRLVDVFLGTRCHGGARPRGAIQWILVLLGAALALYGLVWPVARILGGPVLS